MVVVAVPDPGGTLQWEGRQKSPTRAQTKSSLVLPSDCLLCYLLSFSPPNPHQLLGLSKSANFKPSPAFLLRSKLGSHHSSHLSSLSQSTGAWKGFSSLRSPHMVWLLNSTHGWKVMRRCLCSQSNLQNPPTYHELRVSDITGTSPAGFSIHKGGIGSRNGSKCLPSVRKMGDCQRRVTDGSSASIFPPCSLEYSICVTTPSL